MQLLKDQQALFETEKEQKFLNGNSIKIVFTQVGLQNSLNFTHFGHDRNTVFFRISPWGLLKLKYQLVVITP